MIQKPDKTDTWIIVSWMFSIPIIIGVCTALLITGCTDRVSVSVTCVDDVNIYLSSESIFKENYKDIMRRAVDACKDHGGVKQRF